MTEKKLEKNHPVRNWSWVVYPESAPENWRTLLDETGEKWIESPLHDKDVNPDGELKKAHYHLVLSYKGYKSFEQIDEIARLLHAPIPERVNSLTGSVRYLTHMDNPEKYQYDSSNTRAYGGFDLDSALSLSTGDKRQMLREMIDFIKDNQIIHLVDFTNYCLSDNAPAGWFEILTERNTLFLKEYIKSNWQKYKSGEEMK